MLCGNVSLAQQVKQVPSTITEATVYVSGAEVTRKAQVNLVAGQNIIHLTGLSQYAQIDQLRLSTSGSVTLASSSSLNDYLTEVTLSDEAKELKEKLTEAELKYGVRQGVLEAYKAEKELITSNQGMLGKGGTLDVEDLVALANLCRTRVKEINIKILEISKESEEINKEVSRLRNQFNQVAGSQRNNSHKTFEFILMASSAGNTTIEFSYFVSNVAWVPEYDIKLNTNNTLNLRYKATILQNTGIKWDNAKIAVSTGKPLNSGTKPALYTTYVDYLQEVRGARVNTYKKLDGVAYEAELAEVSMDAVGYQFAEQISGLTTEVFELPGKYSISGNGKPFSVNLKEQNTAADVKYYAVPKYSMQAFLVAKVDPRGLDGLLPGKANCYNNNQLTGTSYFNPFGNEDELLVTLGTDPDIEINRKSLVESQKDGNVISSTKKEYRYQIDVKNKKNKEINIIIEDQIPIPQNTDIVVSSDNISGGQLIQTTGIVKWEISIPAQGNTTLKNFYTIKFPKGKRINH